MAPKRTTLPSHGAASASNGVSGRNPHLEHLRIPKSVCPEDLHHFRCEAWPLILVGPPSLSILSSSADHTRETRTQAKVSEICILLQ